MKVVGTTKGPVKFVCMCTNNAIINLCSILFKNMDKQIENTGTDLETFEDNWKYNRGLKLSFFLSWET